MPVGRGWDNKVEESNQLGGAGESPMLRWEREAASVEPWNTVGKVSAGEDGNQRFINEAVAENLMGKFVLPK